MAYCDCQRPNLQRQRHIDAERHNTYKGATTVNSGTLLVNGNDSSATGTVSVK